MPAYRAESVPVYGGRRHLGAALGLMFAALVVAFLGDGVQQGIAGALRATVLSPFISLQVSLAETRLRAGRAEALLAQVDSMTAVLSTQRALVDENRTLRALLALSARAGPSYRPASVFRPGTSGSESMFLVDVGADHGVRTGSPVVSPDGLVGVIREVGASSAVGMDWTHPDFRASAMLEDGSSFGIVENHRDSFREGDRLVLTGTPYNEAVEAGTRVLTSGLGGVFPRGIPLGTIDGVAEAQGSWLKSYWLRPAAHPASVTHVLVATAPTGEESSPWSEVAVPADSTRGAYP